MTGAPAGTTLNIMKRYKTVDDYVANAEQWQDELERLRGILRSTELTEDVKWGAPCYTFDGQNVVGLAGFKSYFGLWFHQGALLNDKNKALINAQEGATKALRQWRMNSAREIEPAPSPVTPGDRCAPERGHSSKLTVAVDVTVTVDCRHTA